ncbi:MAG: hypothetical protein RL477_1835 [Pseudomonadota bacterium]|jgi:uncharacterized membrane protein YecN with MAPEG domain
MIVTSLYASLLALLFVPLCIRVIRRRRQLRVGVGDGGDPVLLRMQRVQGNFAEYVPFALLLIALAEAQGLPFEIVHAFGLTLLIARVLHAWGVSREPENLRWRVIGMALTFSVLVFGAAANLIMVAMIWLFAE